jgi:hypothetical protein
MATKALDIEINATDKASSVFAKVGENLKKLKSATGEESALGNFAKIAAGTGAVAGLALAGRLINQFADKAKELRQEFNEGSKSAGQVGEELAKSIPVYGEIIAAGRTFRSLIDGTADALADLAKQNAFGKVLDQQADALQRIRKLREQGTDATQKVRDKGDLVGLADPTKSLKELQQQRRDINKQIADNQKNVTADVDAKHAQAIADLQKQAQAAGQKASEAKDTLLEAQGTQHLGIVMAGLRENVRGAGIDQNVSESALKRQILLRQQERKEALAAANKPLQEQLKVNSKQAAVVEDAANQERERRELQHWTTMDAIRSKAQAETLRDQGNELAATIAGKQEEYRAATASLAQRFREGFREATHGGPESPAKVFAKFIEEGFARRGEYDANLRRTVAGSIGQTLLNGFNDAVGATGKALDNWPKKLLAKAGLSGAKFGSDSDYRAPGFTLPDLSPVGGLTGVSGSARERFNAGADGAQAAKDAAKQREKMLKEQQESRKSLVAIAALLRGGTGNVIHP